MTQATERAIRAAFRAYRGGSEKFLVVEEHGLPWVVEWGTGGLWSVVECITNGVEGWDFEQVTAPDED